MFTPPASPLPNLKALDVTGATSEKVPQENPHQAPHKRRRRLLLCIIPVVLLLIGSSTRILSNEAPSLDSTFVSDAFDNALGAPNAQGFGNGHIVRLPFEKRHHLHKKSIVERRGAVDNDTPTNVAEFPPHNPPTGQLEGRASSDDTGLLLPHKTDPPPKQLDTTIPTIQTPAPPVPNPFPQPWDTSLSFNFTTSSCLSFFATQTANDTFRACRSFGLLLGFSSDFFNTYQNLTELSATIGGTCNTTQTVDQCTTVMDWMANEITKDDVCGADIQANNAVALAASNGFKTYGMMREAGCLVNPRTNSYCFVEAVAASSPSDVYYYALPLGTPVPKGTIPSCSTCIQSLLTIYNTYSANTSLLISQTYGLAAASANQQCGAQYAVPGLVHNSTANGCGARSRVSHTLWTSWLLIGVLWSGLGVGAGLLLLL